jgi:hypothetical protein
MFSSITSFVLKITLLYAAAPLECDRRGLVLLPGFPPRKLPDLALPEADCLLPLLPRFL